MLEVTAALIRRDGQMLITRRSPTQHMGGLWEFPGGTVEAGESLPECLQRELREELNIAATVGRRLHTVEHAYPRGPITVHFFAIDAFTGDMVLRVHDACAWVPVDALANYTFAPADVPFVEWLLETSARETCDE